MGVLEIKNYTKVYGEGKNSISVKSKRLVLTCMNEDEIR